MTDYQEARINSNIAYIELEPFTNKVVGGHGETPVDCYKEVLEVMENFDIHMAKSLDFHLDQMDLKQELTVYNGIRDEIESLPALVYQTPSQELKGRIDGSKRELRYVSEEIDQEDHNNYVNELENFFTDIIAVAAMNMKGYNREHLNEGLDYSVERTRDGLNLDAYEGDLVLDAPHYLVSIFPDPDRDGEIMERLENPLDF